MGKVDNNWFKSSASSAAGNCVEVRFRADGADVRDSKDSRGPFLQFTSGEWDAFLDGVRKGEFDQT
jgi:hypothetical protein